LEITGTFIKMEILSNFLYFFKSASVSNLTRVSKTSGNHIWCFLDLRDVLNVSVLCRDTAGLMISRENIQRFLESDSRVRSLGNYKLSFASDATLGLFRRILNRVVQGSEGTLSIDLNSGRVILDIGSAFKDRDTFMASIVNVLPDNEPIPGSYGDEPILKAIEHASFDEYDDFNPRHPQMKTHRRGGSYFNSDIGDCGAEALKGMNDFDMTNLASMAMESLELGTGAESSIPFSRSAKLQKLREQVSGSKAAEAGGEHSP
jgi:hypothetical protein